MILSFVKRAAKAVYHVVSFMVSQVVSFVMIPFNQTVAVTRKEPRSYQNIIADVIRVGVFALTTVAIGNIGLLVCAALMLVGMSLELAAATQFNARNLTAWVFFSTATATTAAADVTTPIVDDVSEAAVVTPVTVVETPVTYDIHEPLPVEDGLDSIANMTPVDTFVELPEDTEEALAIMLNPDAYKVVDTVVSLAQIESVLATHAAAVGNIWNEENMSIPVASPVLNITDEDHRTIRDVGTKAAAHARDLRERLEPGGIGIVYPEGKNKV